MKKISISLENLTDGTARVTARYAGETIAWMDGQYQSARGMIDSVMAKSCYAHRVGTSYDYSYITLNEAAQFVMAA